MKNIFALISLFFLFVVFSFAQEGYKFEDVKLVKTTSVKDQYRSGTCWSFAGLGFYEAELLRMGKGEFDLSEAFIVRHTYIDKAERYLRFHGSINFAGGGAFHDVTNVMKKYGIVPESAYKGLNYGTEKFDHGELDAILKSYMEAIVKSGKPSSAWKTGFIAILDTYLGPEPTEFEYNGKKYTPMSFQKMLGLNFDDYIEISSFTHHPFYEPFILEVPDNWSHDMSWNVPLNEMMDIIKNAINNDYTVAWASDVSDKGFSWTNGVAVLPDVKRTDLSGTEREKWEKLTAKEKSAQLYSFDSPMKEIEVTQESRQIDFDNLSTTDDHGMVIVGIAKDQNGNEYFKIKNSWDAVGKYDGYFYASTPFVMLKTTDILVHKKAIPSNILKKLKL